MYFVISCCCRRLFLNRAGTGLSYVATKSQGEKLFFPYPFRMLSSSEVSYRFFPFINHGALLQFSASKCFCWEEERIPGSNGRCNWLLVVSRKVSVSTELYSFCFHNNSATSRIFKVEAWYVSLHWSSLLMFPMVFTIHPSQSIKIGNWQDFIIIHEITRY